MKKQFDPEVSNTCSSSPAAAGGVVLCTTGKRIPTPAVADSE